MKNKKTKILTELYIYTTMLIIEIQAIYITIIGIEKKIPVIAIPFLLFTIMSIPIILLQLKQLLKTVEDETK